MTNSTKTLGARIKHFFGRLFTTEAYLESLSGSERDVRAGSTVKQEIAEMQTAISRHIQAARADSLDEMRAHAARAEVDPAFAEGFRAREAVDTNYRDNLARRILAELGEDTQRTVH